MRFSFASTVQEVTRARNMAEFIRVPNLGRRGEVVRISRWFCQEGEVVHEGAPLFELEAEKAVLEVESPATGVLLKIKELTGAEIPVLSVVAVVGTPDESYQFPDSVAIPVPQDVQDLATKLDVSLLDIHPSGKDGRMTPDDVHRAHAERPQQLNHIRQTAARRLRESKQTIPHFYVTVKADVTDLLLLRRELKKQHLTISVNDCLLKASAAALQEYPIVNSTVVDGRHVILRTHIALGMAVNTEHGLLVPVIKNIDQLSVLEIHNESRHLIQKAVAGKLYPAEMRGATFTVSNMSMMNVEEFVAIINPGESAILAVGSPILTPTVSSKGDLVIRELMSLTLSSDHRIIDGALAAAFLNTIRRKLEDMDYWREQVSGN